MSDAIAPDESDPRPDRGGLPAFSPATRALVAAGGARLPALPDGRYPEGDIDGVPYRALLLKYIGLALKYRVLVIAVLVIAGALGFVVTYAMTPIFRATAVIEIDREAAKVVKVDQAPDIDLNSSDDLRFYQTEYDLLKSRSLATRVAANLDLADAQDFLRTHALSPWEKLKSLLMGSSAGGAPSFADRQAVAGGRVQRGLTVSPVPNSRLVNISFDSASAEWAQRVANGIAQNFIQDNLDRRYAASSYARQFLSERLEDLKIKLEESEKKLVAYAEQKQIVADDAKASLQATDMAALDSALQTAKIQRIHDQQLWEQAQATKGVDLPQVLSNTAVQTLLQQRAVLLADYQQKLSQFKPDYPVMLQLKSQLRGFDQEIAAATRVIKNALKAQFETSRDQEDSLEAQVTKAKAGVLDLRGKSIEYNILMREVDTSRTLYNGLLQQYKDVGVAGAVATNNISMVDAATIPGVPYTPNLRKNLAIALVLGALIAVVLVALRELLDDSFKAPEEVEEQLGLAVLGIIPYVNGDVLELVRESPRSAIAEAYRSMRTALQFSTEIGVPKSLLVTSARPGDGKSTIAMALAVNLAHLGLRVLLIDADLRKTEADRGHGDEEGQGLSNILAGATDTGSVIRDTKFAGLSLIAAGPLPPNPAELLAGPKMASLLSDVAEKFDVTVMDGPPVMNLTDAPLLASLAGGTIMVVAAGEGRRGAIRVALRRLHFARARMIGSVLNKFDSRKVGYGYGYGYGGYGYGGYGYGDTSYSGSKGKSMSQRLQTGLITEQPAEKSADL